MTTIIDVHWHHVPKAFADQIVSGEVPIAGQVVTKDDGSALVKMDNGFKQPLPPFLTDPGDDHRRPRRGRRRRGVRVDRATAVAPRLRSADRARREPGDQRRTAEVAEQHDGRIMPLANVPLQDVDLALQELKRVVDDYGFKGVQVGSNIGGKNLGDESHFPFWEQVRELDLFVFSHGLSPLGPERMSEHELKNFVGSADRHRRLGGLAGVRRGVRTAARIEGLLSRTAAARSRASSVAGTTGTATD